jgi:cytidylate kinase
MMEKGFVIAIDGPVASGKGTIAPMLAEKLQGFYLYTGATYRALALHCIQNNIDVHNIAAVFIAAKTITIDLNDHEVLLNGLNVTQAIRDPKVAQVTPIVAAIPEIRALMVAWQQKIAGEKIGAGKVIVIEGRDTATVVFPEAALKVFLTAKPEIRARRRFLQLQASGDASTYEDVLVSLHKRDKEDTQRAADPLVKDPEKNGYYILDDSDLSEEQTLSAIIEKLPQ